MTSLLCVRNLSLSYPSPRKRWRRSAPVVALQDVSFDLAAGERLGLLGMSGSGKSSLLRCLLALERPQAGHIHYQGRAVAPGSIAALRWYRRAAQYVPQDPIASLEPRMNVAQLVAEPLLRLGGDGDIARRTEEALESVGLDHRFLSRRPDELSGGQAQRVAIARAIATRPALLLTDEPVSGLDMTIRAQVIDVLRELSNTHGTAIVMVSHDVSIIAGLCQRAMVMEQGRLVEDRPTPELLKTPQHPHTRALLEAAPPLVTAA
ncbi:ABC transporter ATP-binding protein [Halomonas dongshanensis]|uniref:ABC transporter ATP-binding protein n=1 Tax=Halomonas dongshanensis TaxID=2890835 RepID=A0ABT2EBV1_9GAMM|nr:ABC transporter ATP-binding protein [Halomonas dongshanensis]MCS2608570.1 ABC transporter ATP-binding protein [Halomonas dongshanensis]